MLAMVSSPSRTSLRSFTIEVTETTKPFQVSEIENRKSEIRNVSTSRAVTGSLTTFNIIFKNKDDQFRTSAVDRPTG